jgi:cytochrome c oxidase subunit 2
MERNGLWILSSLAMAVLLLGGCKGSEREASEETLAKESYKSNGEQIYFTATSRRNEVISSEMKGMMHMRGGSLACVNCHGPDGKGRSVQMMMGTFDAPDIRYRTLTSPEHGEEGTEASSHDMEHPPYTDETIKQAITKGIDPAGHPLKSFMPRWRMSDEDLDDLIDFLKTLS